MVFIHIQVSISVICFIRTLFTILSWHKHHIVPFEEDICFAVDSEAFLRSNVAKGKSTGSDSYAGATACQVDLSKLQAHRAPDFLLRNRDNATCAKLLRDTRNKTPGQHWAWHVKGRRARSYCPCLCPRHYCFRFSPFAL